jgi:LPXTG-motif cell wall-anchored protein
MKTRNIIIIGVLVLGGAYWLYKRSKRKQLLSQVADAISKPQREIAEKPQTSSPNVQKPSMSSTEATNTSVKNFMDFDGELELHKND